MSLELMNIGERGEITEIRHCGGCGGGCHAHEDHGHNHSNNASGTRAERMGLRVGKMVEVLKNDGRQLMLLVDEISITIDRNIARNIHVRGYAV